MTISAHTETGHAEEEIAVPLQRTYTGTKPVIPAILANSPCTIFGLRGLLERLNTVLGTSHTLDNSTLSSLLEGCIAKNYDFGTAYGFLRPAWYTEDWSSILDRIHECEEIDREMRQKALHGNNIVGPFVHPRRAWDLYSNRVVPHLTTGMAYPHGISHSWVDKHERTDMWTPINGFEWPAPIPKDASLDLIRIELLNKGLEYVWLDVLCLRQEGGRREDLRVEEWMLDVPTIGSLYHQYKTYCYLSGLGRPLRVTEDYFDSDRCWFNRAWTLQEIGSDGYEICGFTPDGPLDAKCDKDGNYDTEVLTTFHQKLQGPKRLNFQPFEVLEEMRRRVSTNPVDKIAGMAILLLPRIIPTYNGSRSQEDAWTALMNTMLPYTRADLLFCYPEPGNGDAKWRPSWDQVMTTSLPRDYRSDGLSVGVERVEETNVDQCETFCIESGFVQGWLKEVRQEPIDMGSCWLMIRAGYSISPLLRTTGTLIPEDTYTLIRKEFGYWREGKQWLQWVVGRRLSDERFEKLSVFEMAEDVVARMLDDLSLEKRVNILV